MKSLEAAIDQLIYARLIYARRREWSGLLTTDWLKLRDPIVETVEPYTLPPKGSVNFNRVWQSIKREHPGAVGMKVFPRDDVSWSIEVIEATDGLEPQVYRQGPASIHTVIQGLFDDHFGVGHTMLVPNPDGSFRVVVEDGHET